MLQYVPRRRKTGAGQRRVGEDEHGGERRQVGIQEAMGRGASPLRKYQDLVVGSRGLGRLVLYEAVMLASSWVPGALGLVLRKLLYPLLLGSVGKGVVFGQGVVLRHPHKMRLGDGVTVDDLVVLDAKGTTNRGIDVGRGVFLGRGTILSCKDGDIAIGDHGNFGFHCEVFSGSSVTVGKHGLFAAQSYLVGGGHEFEQRGPRRHRPAALVARHRARRQRLARHGGEGARRGAHRPGRGGGRQRGRERGPARRGDRGRGPGPGAAAPGGHGAGRIRLESGKAVPAQRCP